MGCDALRLVRRMWLVFVSEQVGLGCIGAYQASPKARPTLFMYSTTEKLD